MAKQAEEGETESLLSVTDKDDNKSGVRKAQTKEEEHQVILEAMQKRFVCPNFAVPAPRAVSSATHMDNGFDQRGQGKKVAAGHMKMLPVESANEVDQLIARLDDAFQTHKPPFDTWDNLLDKFSDIQRKQLVLNYANLELAWTKNSAGRDGDSGVTFRQHLTTFQEMVGGNNVVSVTLYLPCEIQGGRSTAFASRLAYCVLHILFVRFSWMTYPKTSSSSKPSTI